MLSVLLAHQKLLHEGHLVSDKALEGSVFDSDITRYFHLRILLDFLDLHYKKKMEAEARRHRPSKDRAPTATYQMLWMLFKPGTRVYSLADNDLAGFIVKSITAKYRGSQVYKLSLWHLNYNGNVYV